MNKKALVLAAALLGLTFASCKKDYTCTCTVTSTIMGQTTTSTASGTITDTKADAKARCDEGDNTTDFFGTTMVTQCEID